MQIYVYRISSVKTFGFLGIIEEFSSLQWTRRYHKSGEFELQCGLTPVNASLLQIGNILWKPGDDEAGYIESVDLKQEENGEETIDAKGYFLTNYLKRRILWGTETMQGTIENVMRSLVNRHCIAPVDSSRAIPMLCLGTLNNLAPQVSYQAQYANLSDELESLSNLGDLGFKVTFAPQQNQMVFSVYQGLNRSAVQSKNPQAVFCREYENVLAQEYANSLNNYRNVALIGGEDSATDKKTAVTGNASALERYELYVDAGDLGSTIQNSDGSTTQIGDSDYQAMMIDKGNTELAGYTRAQSFESTLSLQSNLIYKEDFDLGDLVTCISKSWGVSINARITEIQEVYEESGLSVTVTFGSSIPTLVDKINQKIR